MACTNFDRALVPTSASPSLSPPSTFALAFDARFGSVVIVVVVSSAVVSSIVVVVVVVDMMMDDSIARGNDRIARSRRCSTRYTHIDCFMCDVWARIRTTDPSTLLFRVL